MRDYYFFLAAVVFFRFVAQYRFIPSDVASLAPSKIPWRVFVIHNGRLPRLFPCPSAMLSNTMIVCSTCSRAVRSSAIIFGKFIWISVACRYK